MAYKKNQLSAYKGRYFRNLGRALDARGRLAPKMFLLGTDKAKAELASRLLERLWDAVVAEHAEAAAWLRQMGGRLGDCNAVTGEWDPSRLRNVSHGPVWRAESLLIAEVIRDGEREVEVLPWQGRGAAAYVEQLASLKRTYPVIAFVPALPELVAEGRRLLQGTAAVLTDQAREFAEVSEAPLSEADGRTLHEALEAYAAFAKARTTKESGVREAEAALRLKRSYADVPLSQFNVTAMDGMAAY